MIPGSMMRIDLKCEKCLISEFGEIENILDSGSVSVSGIQNLSKN